MKPNTDPAEIHAMVVGVLNKVGYRPHGADGSAWEHPNGTRVTTGYTGGQLRLRRFPADSHRVGRIPPVIWDIDKTPDEPEVAMFVGGERAPAPDLTAEQLAILERFEEADYAPESLREKLALSFEIEVESLGLPSISGRLSERLADVALEVIRGER